MHELSTMIRLVDLAERRAREAGAGKILRIEVSVGEMTGILPYWLERYFPEASQGTAAQGALLQIRSVPVRVCCLGCGCGYIPDRGTDRACPLCGSIRGKILSGREITLDRLELEDSSGTVCR